MASHLSLDVSRWTTGLTSMCPAAASSRLGFVRVATAAASARAPGLEDARPGDDGSRTAVGRVGGARSRLPDEQPPFWANARTLPPLQLSRALAVCDGAASRAATGASCCESARCCRRGSSASSAIHRVTASCSEPIAHAKR
jgi:hypothetical protein